MIGEHVPNRTPFLLEHGLQEVGKAIVKGPSELLVGKGLGQVILGEKAVPHGPADGGSQPGLVFGDGSLKKGKASPEELGGFVGVEEHPHRHGVGEASGQGSEHHGQDCLQNLLGHGQRCE